MGLGKISNPSWVRVFLMGVNIFHGYGFGIAKPGGFVPVAISTRKVPTNPRWYPYAKGSPHEAQGSRSSNSIESRGPSPLASGAPLLAPLGRSLPSPLLSYRLKMLWASFPPVHSDGRDTNVVATVSQDSRPTRYNYNDSRKIRGVVWFF
jgi:YD repeat-containing protein